MAESNQGQPWWAVATSEEVTDKKPLSVDVGDQPLVLWRDRTGAARALEDRCPHRRAPLSLGCIRDNGWIQCGYHGWSYEGETGRLQEIPNMKDQQKFPPVYRAQAFRVAETDGFIRVNLDAQTPYPRPRGETYKHASTVHVSLEHRQFLDALYDDPSLVIAIRGVHFTPYLLSELRREGDLLVMERSCQWRPRHWPATFTSDFPITLESRTHRITGETWLALRDSDFNVLLRAVLAPVPAARGVTAIRSRFSTASSSVRTPIVLRGPKAFQVLRSVDGERLRTTKPTVSLHGEDLKGEQGAVPTEAAAA